RRRASRRRASARSRASRSRRSRPRRRPFVRRSLKEWCKPNLRRRCTLDSDAHDESVHESTSCGVAACAERTRAPPKQGLAPGDDLERSWLEAVEYLAEPCYPFLVA